MDVSRMSVHSSHLTSILRGEKFDEEQHAIESADRLKDKQAFAEYCRRADLEEIEKQKLEAQGLIGRRRRQKRDRHYDPRAKLADTDDVGECHTHGKPDIVTGRRPGVKLDNQKSHNLRLRGQVRAKLMRNFKYGFVISYLYEFRDRMRDCFTVMDKDGSGELNRTEFDDGLHETLGIRLSDNELEALFHIVDVDKSDHVEWHEVQAVLRQAPKVVYVGLEEFHAGMVEAGYNLTEEQGELLYAKVCLEVSDDHGFEEDAHTDKIELRKIRYVDLHRQLKPMRMKNMRIQLIKTFNPESLNALNDAETASGQVWRVETASVDIYRKLRDLTPTLQRDTLFNFAEACNLDPTIDSKHQFNAKETISHYQLETLNAMMKDAVLKTEAYATHLKVLGLDPDDPDVKRKVYALDHGGTLESLMLAKPLTLTERSGLECAQGYVRGLMNSKLSRVRDIFRAMDDDGSGSVTEEEFHYGLRKIGIQGVSMKDVKLLFKAIDTDKGGTVSYQELRDGLRDRSGSGGGGGSGLRYEGFQCACQMLGLFPLLCPSDGSDEELMEEKDDEEKIEVDIEKIKPNCLKLFQRVSVRERETSRIRIVDYKTMVKAVAHLRLMKYKTKRTDSNNRSLAKYKYMDQTSPSSEKSKQQPKPPPRPPPRLNNVGKNMLRNSMYIHEQEEANGGIISKQQASKLVGDWVSGGSRKEKKKKKKKKTKAEIQLEKQKEQVKKKRDEKFFNLVSMFPKRIQEQMIDMASAFPHEIKSICKNDWIALLSMTTKQQNRVLERMYNRLCDPKNLSATELAKLKADQEKRRMEGRHRGCKSCKAKLKHAVGEDMYLGSIEEALLKEQEPIDPYPVPDWLSGDAGKYTFDDWTVESLLDTHATQATNTKNEELGDMEWGPSNGSSSSKGGRSQTARVRFKPTNTGRNNAANHRRTATAPLLRSGQRSSSPRQRSPGVLMSAPKPIDVGVPVYFKQETAKKINFIGRYGNSKAQNSQLELVKNVYNDVASDPHNNEYKKSLAKGKGTYDRFILPRTDLGNKLARLGAYRNVPMELTYNGRV